MKAIHVIWHLNSLALQSDGNSVIRVWLGLEGKIFCFETQWELCKIGNIGNIAVLVDGFLRLASIVIMVTLITVWLGPDHGLQFTETLLWGTWCCNLFCNFFFWQWCRLVERKSHNNIKLNMIYWSDIRMGGSKPHNWFVIAQKKLLWQHTNVGLVTWCNLGIIKSILLASFPLSLLWKALILGAKHCN